MRRATEFYRSLRFELLYGGGDATFTSFRAGTGYLNLQVSAGKGLRSQIWGRVIFWVDDVDAMYETVRTTGSEPEGPPTDAPWGERYFHVRDPDGHELSFARPLRRSGG
jgi:catechol 2,3-dioxygenase-like lactoylglutathione lyase family enzyme